MFALCAWALASCGQGIPGGTIDGDAGVDLTVTADDGGDQPPPGEGDGGETDAACVPTVTSCSGLCGPVTDRCQGRTFQCGGCPDGQVCDLVNHTCAAPQVTCMALGIACGPARNSCGKRLDCGECGAGQECDIDSGTCVTCQSVTCQDLGYECGMAWLGCGPTSNTTNCGSCSTGKTCNPYYHICEPTGAAPTAAKLCADARAARGVECGVITNGHGGIVDCGGCPIGKACGARGVANRCEPAETPPECVALGKNCGSIPSACGGTVNCGTCPTGQVCNANGVCGAPCAPKTCQVDYAGMCGRQLDDGCSGKLDCLVCPTGNTCSTGAQTGQLGTCVTTATCATYNANGGVGSPCSNGASASFPKGDGSNLTCRCGGTAVCVNGMKVVSGGTVGTCCQNQNTCAPGECGTTKINSCTGATITCGCSGSTQYCDTASKTCKTKNTCATYGANGQPGQVCSNGASPSFPRGDGVNLTCLCGSGVCVNGMTVVSGGTTGTCCVNTNTCAPGECNTTKVDSCTGATITCACSGNTYCDTATNQCKAFNNCGAYTTGSAGQPCSNGASPSFPRGDGQNLTCPCNAGLVCVNGMMVVSGSTTGTCCQNTASCGNSCDTTVINTCTGATITCACTGSNYCDPMTKTCVAKKTCSTYGATGGVGAPCNPNPFYDDGTGTLFPCGCSTAGGNANNTCVGASPTQAGTCQCTPKVCTQCATTTTSNGCGGTLDCRCTGGQVCNGTTGQCCTPYSCSSPPPGVPAGACGTFSNGCGSSFSCACDTSGGKTNNKCVPVSGQSYGTCQCIPTSCTVLGAGTHANDGCGKPVTCQG